MSVCFFTLNQLKLNKIKTQFPLLHQPHVKHSVATCGCGHVVVSAHLDHARSGYPGTGATLHQIPCDQALLGTSLLAYGSQKSSIIFPGPCSVCALSLGSLSPSGLRSGELFGGSGSILPLDSFKPSTPAQISLVDRIFFLPEPQAGLYPKPLDNAPNLSYSPQPLPLPTLQGGTLLGGEKLVSKQRIWSETCEVPKATPHPSKLTEDLAT